MSRLLVTGFGPFPRMPRNPSAALARAVAATPRLRLLGIEARAAILTTAYATLPGELDPLLAAEPDAVLMIGVAGRSRPIRIESRGTSRRSLLFPDVHGDVPDRPRTRRTADVANRSTRVNKVAALRHVRRHGLPGRHSRDAGRYLCNAAYFRALALATPVLFVHIPRTPRSRPARSSRLTGPRWNEALRRALVDVAIAMIRDGRRVAGARTIA